MSITPQDLQKLLAAAVSRTYSHIDTATLRTAIDKMPDSRPD
jgi:hypothetical protein